MGVSSVRHTNSKRKTENVKTRASGFFRLEFCVLHFTFYVWIKPALKPCLKCVHGWFVRRASRNLRTGRQVPAARAKNVSFFAKNAAKPRRIWAQKGGFRVKKCVFWRKGCTCSALAANSHAVHGVVGSKNQIGRAFLTSFRPRVKMKAR